MPKSAGVEFGDFVEGECQAALDHLQAKNSWFYQRLYDTRSAGNFLPNMPADFIAIAQGGTGCLLEVKGSVTHKTFASRKALTDMLQPHQALGSYLASRAGGVGLILFASQVSKTLELWDGAAVREVFIIPRQPLTDRALLYRTEYAGKAIKEKVILMLLEYFKNRKQEKVNG